MPVRDLTIASVDLYLAALVVVLLVLDLVLPRDWRKPKAIVAALGLLGGLGPVWLRGGLPPALEFGGAYVVDDFALFFKALVLVAGAVVALLSVDYFRRLPRAYGVLLPAGRGGAGLLAAGLGGGPDRAVRGLRDD